nr:unnamed protein product [Callosobruchus analis]
MDSNPFGKKEDVYGYQTLWRELGYYISRLEHYERSLKFFDEAIKKTPNDKRALIGRARARAKACQYEGALEDVNKALSFDPDDLVVLADKALNTYLSCEFEEGLVQNTRPLRDHFKIIRKLAWKRNFEAQKPFQPKARKGKKKKKKDLGKQLEFIQPKLKKKPKRKSVRGSKGSGGGEAEKAEVLSIRDSLHSQESEKAIVPPYPHHFPFRPLQNYTTNIENYMAEKYLDSMYLEKIFLKKLQYEHGAKSPNQKGSEKIIRLAKEGYKAVSYKQELLRTRSPFYYIKYQEAHASGSLKARQAEELILQQQITKKEADVLMNKLIACFENKQLQHMLQVAEKLKYYCDSKPKRIMPDKDNYLQEILRKIRRGFYELNRLNKNQMPYEQPKRIYVAFGYPVSREPSTDSVIKQFKNVYLDHKKQIELFEKRLQQAETNDQLCWCYHELSRYHLETKKWELARVYSRKCIQESIKEEGHPEWHLNALMLLVRINIQQHNKNDARTELQEGIAIADQLQDENLKEYLEKCLEVVETIEFDDLFGPKMLEKREQKMLSMMSTPKMKDEFAHLFRMMAAMPASRRMTVMPGVRMDDSKDRKYDGALEDINKALSFDPDDLVVLADKALNTYLSCEFEEGLVQNTRLLPRRQKPDHFSMGVMLCTNAIETCIGERSGRPLRDHFKIIRKLAWKMNFEAQKPFQPIPRKRKKKKKSLGKVDFIQPINKKKHRSKSAHQGATESKEGEGDNDADALSIKDSLHSEETDRDIVPPYPHHFPFRPLQNYTTNIENFMAEKYLGSMYLEKIFLKKLQYEHGARSPNQKGTEKIIKLAKEGYKAVSYKQELLRTRRPFYYIKFLEAHASSALKARQAQELIMQQMITKNEADVLMNKLIECSEKKQLQKLLQVAEKLKSYCDSKPKRIMPDKDEYLNAILVRIRRGFYDLNRLNKKQIFYEQHKRIFAAFAIPLSREPSTDSVIKEFKNVYVDYKKQIELFERRLLQAVTNDQLCWCYHELSRYHLELKKWELARVYSRKCIQESKKEEGHPEWVLNALMLLVRIDIQQHNKNDARSELLEACDLADKLQDENLREFDDIFGPKVLEKRQQKMLSMMATPKMKDEFAHLFRMMAAMPASRRMTVIPGVRVGNTDKSKKKSSRMQSIIPNTVREDQTMVKERIRQSKGFGFMELVQYHV